MFVLLFVHTVTPQQIESTAAYVQDFYELNNRLERGLTPRTFGSVRSLLPPLPVS